MKFIQLLFALTLCLYGCNRQSNDLNVPENVIPKRSTSSQQFPGTRIFLQPPKGYQLVQQLLRFQKNDATFIQVFELPATGFDPQKLKEKIAEKRSGGQLDEQYYQKEFRLGVYRAMLVFGPDNQPGMDQMVLAFGDDRFAVMAAGELRKGNNIARDEILRSLLTLYVDTTIVANARVLATYTLDLTNTEFKYAGNRSQTYVYNLGDSTLNNEEFANEITVSTFPGQKPAALKDFAISMISRYKSAGIEIPDYRGREITLNGNYAYEIELTGSYKGRAVSDYLVVTSNANSALLFNGSAYDRRAEVMSQIKKIASTLRPK